MGRTAVAVACFLALACTPASPTTYPSVSWVSKHVEHGPPPSRIRISDAVAVEGCQYLGDFVFENYASRGSPYWWADSQVLLLAAAKGATDVVFDTKSRAYFVGKGYRCS